LIFAGNSAYSEGMLSGSKSPLVGYHETLPDLSGRILCLVDDDPDEELLVKALLKGTGAELKTFLDGREALAYLQSEPVDLVLLDVMMPELDGWELHAQLRTAGVNVEVPVLFVTCIADERVESKMRDPNMRCSTLPKPLEKRKFLNEVNRLLS
jgi:response regulator RpfG family c-di-GMP phosphodiesterase